MNPVGYLAIVPVVLFVFIYLFYVVSEKSFGYYWKSKFWVLFISGAILLGSALIFLILGFVL